jgi:uncharacterized repeat protein (TIGR01451 family)
MSADLRIRPELALRLGVAAIAALSASPAMAAGTTAGTTITNTTSIAYDVSGVTQTAVSASDALTVDRKIDLTVAETGSATTTVSPGQTSAVTTFTVTNVSNATLDLALASTQQSGGSGPHSDTDTFDATNLRTYVDSNANGTYDAGTDTQVTYLDEVAADASKTVFVLADIPLGKVTGDVAVVVLTATGREGGGSGSEGVALTQTTGANTSGMDTVFADGAGSTDSAGDAAYSARDDYTAFAAALTVTKTSTIISDPINGTTNPKFIPGATLQYCVIVANAAGSATATNVTISDTLPATLTYYSAYGIKVDGTVSSGTCATDGTSGGSFSSGTVSGTLSSIAASQTRTLLFRATIN